jgi:hypothetical protein
MCFRCCKIGHWSSSCTKFASTRPRQFEPGYFPPPQPQAAQGTDSTLAVNPLHDVYEDIIQVQLSSNTCEYKQPSSNTPVSSLRPWSHDPGNDNCPGRSHWIDPGYWYLLFTWAKLARVMPINTLRGNHKIFPPTLNGEILLNKKHSDKRMSYFMLWYLQIERSWLSAVVKFSVSHMILATILF